MKIIGQAECTAEQMAQYLVNRNSAAVSFALEYARLYLEEGAVEGVRGDGAWVQACKETHYFLFDMGTAVTFDQNNFCGLGVTKKGMKGASFDTPRLGIRAQIQHLKGYGSAKPLANVCIDPRYSLISPKGKAPTFEELTGKWSYPGYDTNKASSLEDAMAKGIGYGFDIVNGINAIKAIGVDGAPKVDNSTDKKETTEGKKLNMKYKVAIDAGHGSQTAGKRTVDGYKEHWINVMTAKYCDAYLTAKGVNTVRIGWNDDIATDDADIALATRQKTIKTTACDLSVSIHANASGNGSIWNSASGVETLYHTEASKRADSIRLANMVQNQVIKGTQQKNRGVKAQNLAMCNCSAMGTKASCLVEIAFMTNEHEAKLLKTETFCKEQGEDIAKGIMEYLDYLAEKDAASASTPKQTTSTSKSSVPHIVKCLDDLNIRKTPGGTIVKPNGCKKGLKYTIVEENGTWGRLKSGAGWITIKPKYVERV